MRLLVRLLVCSSALLPGMGAAATWTVSPDGPYTSIQAAVDLAQPGDLVLVQPGTYQERLTLRDGVSIAAANPGSAIVEGEGEGPVLSAVRVGSTTRISGLVLQHGSSLSGGGLLAVSSSARFTDCSFVSNAAILGGGAYLSNGSRAVFSHCSFSDNSATLGGGLYLDFSAITLDGCTVFRNQASDGGALSASNAAEATVVFTCFYDNTTRLGNTIACNQASPSFTNCTVVSNTGDVGSFGLRGSGTRIERCIVAFNGGPAIACSGFSSPWVGCSILFGNQNESICSGDQGTNLNVNPLFCDPIRNNFEVSADSPATGGTCGAIGAYSVACPAQGVASAVTPASWSQLKSFYR